MFDHDEAPAVQRMIERLQAPVQIDPGLDGRVMARIGGGAAPDGRLGTFWAWLRRPQPIPVSPLAFLLTAAALAGVAIWWRGSPPAAPAAVPVASNGGREAAPVQFVVTAPGASSVALVGDFNDWDATRTPMRLAGRGGNGTTGLWTVVVPLRPGRHRYAFLVNGSRWVADPAAPRAPDDFGTPSSVVTVGG